jgi:alkane 1-monooxygenase
MKSLSVFWYLVCLIPTVFVVLGNLLGSWWSAGNMVFTLGFLVLVDFVFGKNHRPVRPESTEGDLILILACLAHWVSVGSLLYGIFSGILSGPTLVYAAVSTGLNAGLIGITSAHELIHRKDLRLRRFGLVNLTLCLYLHFDVEHRKGHHARVGTLEDPATARKGESFYRFLLRTIPGQWGSAWKLEAARQNRMGKPVWNRRNFMVQSLVVQSTLLLLLGVAGGTALLLGFGIQAFVAIFLLEYVNYIEHYGLVRKPGEPIQAHHAWQSESASSRFHLFELSRHSHHHMDARVPYPDLRPVPSAYELPFGYFGMFYIALLPPLWFSVMHPRLPHVKTS